MDPGYSIEELGDVLAIRMLRALSKEEILSIIDIIARRPKHEKRLWDLGEHLRLTADNMSEIGDYGRRKIEGPSRVAYVAADDLTFGLTNIQAAYRTVSGFEDQLFRDEASALAWLAGDRRS